MRVTRTHGRIQIHGDQNITFRIFNAKVMKRNVSVSEFSLSSEVSSSSPVGFNKCPPIPRFKTGIWADSFHPKTTEIQDVCNRLSEPSVWMWLLYGRTVAFCLHTPSTPTGLSHEHDKKQITLRDCQREKLFSGVSFTIRHNICLESGRDEPSSETDASARPRHPTQLVEESAQLRDEDTRMLLLL